MNKTGLNYRKGTLGIVIDDDQNFLIVQMNNYDINDWRFPGGGVEEGEEPEEAVLRELQEELGTDKFEILKKSSHVVKYDWPESVIEERLKIKGETYMGQEQSQFLIKFTGVDSDIHLDPGEMRKMKWVKYDELEKHFTFKNQWSEAKKSMDEMIG